MKYFYSLTILLILLQGCQNGSENQPRLEERMVYYESGKLKGRFFVDEQERIQGLSYRYYESGKLKEVRRYQDGVSNGIVKEFYENGNLKSKAVFKNDIQVDTTYQYYESGKLEAMAVYDGNGEQAEDVFLLSKWKYAKETCFHCR